MYPNNNNNGFNPDNSYNPNNGYNTNNNYNCNPNLQGNMYQNQPMVGSQKTKIKSSGDQYTFQQKSAYTDAMGRTQKLNVKAKEGRDSSNSSEKRRRGNDYAQQPHGYMPGNNFAPNMHNPNMPFNQAGYMAADGYAHEKGKIVQNGNSVRTAQNLQCVDPVTGIQQEAQIKTKVIERSRSKSQGKKSKHTYDNTVKGTANGPELEMKEKSRQGGVMDNIKNKLHNLVHH